MRPSVCHHKKACHRHCSHRLALGQIRGSEEQSRTLGLSQAEFLLERRKGGLKPRIPASRPRARRRGVYPAQQLGVRRHHDACRRATPQLGPGAARSILFRSLSTPGHTPRPPALARVRRGHLRRRLEQIADQTWTVLTAIAPAEPTDSTGRASPCSAEARHSPSPHLQPRNPGKASQNFG